jgi:hypothetical protein
MRHWGWSGVAAAVAILLAGCGDVRKQAAPHVRAFLASAEADKPMIFEAHIDRIALRADLKGQLMSLPEVRELYDQLGDGTGEAAVDQMISPESFRAFRAGSALAERADDKAIAKRLKVMGKDRVCLPDRAKKDLCLLTFARQGRTWKLVGLHAPDLRASAPGSF